jgi:predicted ATPase
MWIAGRRGGRPASFAIASPDLFAEICRRVDGLPLAIELAAARVAGLDPVDIASHLDDLFTLLPQPARRADGAQRSLRATVEWSDALLTEEERRLLPGWVRSPAGSTLARSRRSARSKTRPPRVSPISPPGSSRSRCS